MYIGDLQIVNVSSGNSQLSTTKNGNHYYINYKIIILKEMIINNFDCQHS